MERLKAGSGTSEDTTNCQSGEDLQNDGSGLGAGPPGVAGCPETTVLDRLHLLFGLSHEAFVVTTPDGAIVEVNDATLKMFGYCRDEMLRINVRDLYEEPAQRDVLAGELHSRSVVNDRELRLVRKDGTVLDCLCSFAVSRNDAGTVVAFCGGLRDLSDSKQRHDQLKASEAKYRSLFEQSHDAISLVSPDGTLLDANPAYLRLFGYSKADIGRANLIEAYVNAEDRAQFLRCMAEYGMVEDEVRFCTRAGTVLDCARSAVERRDESGRLVAFQSVHRNITGQKRLHDELVQAHARTERMLEGMVHVIEQITERRDAYTAGHQRRAAELSTAIARRMGLPEDTCVCLIDMAARVHDIGKIGVPAEILSKPGRLTSAEMALIREHPQVAYQILSEAELPHPVAEAVLQHHERMDGTGYPRGLSGNDILPEAMILIVADVMEAMSSHRPYRPALGVEAALAELASGSGRLYDADVVSACIAVFRDTGFRFSG